MRRLTPLVIWLVILAMLALTFLGAGTGNVILVIGLVFAPLIARTVRAAALVEARKEYVQAAQLRGEGALYIMAVELLPNVRGPLIVDADLQESTIGPEPGEADLRDCPRSDRDRGALGQMRGE